MSLDALIHREQHPSADCRRCVKCGLVSYHRDSYTPANLANHAACWTCKLLGEPYYFRTHGFAGVGERS